MASWGKSSVVLSRKYFRRKNSLCNYFFNLNLKASPSKYKLHGSESFFPHTLIKYSVLNWNTVAKSEELAFHLFSSPAPWKLLNASTTILSISISGALFSASAGLFPRRECWIKYEAFKSGARHIKHKYFPGKKREHTRSPYICLSLAVKWVQWLNIRQRRLKSATTLQRRCCKSHRTNARHYSTSAHDALAFRCSSDKKQWQSMKLLRKKFLRATRRDSALSLYYSAGSQLDALRATESIVRVYICEISVHMHDYNLTKSSLRSD